MIEDILRSALFDHASGVHDHDVVRHLGDYAQVVSDEHDGGIDAVLQLPQQIQNLCLDGDIQRSGGLVSDDDLGIAGQSHGDDHALPHAAGEFMGIHHVDTLGVGNTDHLQQLNGALLDLLIALPFSVMESDDLVDLLPDPEDRVQGSHRLLEDHGDGVSAQMLENFVRGFGHVIGFVPEVQTDCTVDYLTLRTLEQLHQREAGDGLAAAGLAHDADRFPDGNIKAHTVDSFDRACIRKEIGVEIVELHRVVQVAHGGDVFRFGNIPAFALFFIGVGNAPVFTGNSAGFSCGEIAVVFLVCHSRSLLNASSSGRRRHADRLRRG